MKTTQMTIEQRNKIIVELYQRGIRPTEIAKMLGVSRNVVKNTITRLDVPRMYPGKSAAQRARAEREKKAKDAIADLDIEKQIEMYEKREDEAEYLPPLGACSVCESAHMLRRIADTLDRIEGVLR